MTDFFFDGFKFLFCESSLKVNLVELLPCHLGKLGKLGKVSFTVSGMHV
jgi:hypothetical protein